MELSDYLSILRTHWMAILAVTLAGAAVGFGYSALQPRVYTASASGYVAAADAGDNSGASLIGDQLAQAKVTSYVDIGGWRTVAESAIAELGLATAPEQLVQAVTVSNPLNTVIIKVTADAASPEAARDLAEAWIRGMVAQIDLIEGDGSAGSAAVTLIPGEAAALPTAPSSPNVALNGALGALIGLAVGIGYAVVRRALDRRVRDAVDVESETGTAVIGTLPWAKDAIGGGQLLAFDRTAPTTPEGMAVTEALRALRINLQYLDVDRPPRIILVTSPLPGDGKSTTAANLALSLAAAGQRTVLVDADLRRPMLATMFGIPPGGGLSDVLAGRADVDDVGVIDATGRLLVVPAGRIPPNPTEVLGSNRMRELLHALADSAIVVVDTAPTIPVADAAALSAAADGVLMVLSAGRTTVDVLHRALQTIAKAGGRVLGAVLNKVPSRERDYGGYGYYGPAVTPAAEPDPAGVRT